MGYAEKYKEIRAFTLASARGEPAFSLATVPTYIPSLSSVLSQTSSFLTTDSGVSDAGQVLCSSPAGANPSSFQACLLLCEAFPRPAQSSQPHSPLLAGLILAPASGVTLPWGGAVLRWPRAGTCLTRAPLSAGPSTGWVVSTE